MTAGSLRAARIPILFNEVQLAFKPLYEWAFGEKIDHPETTARAESILAAVQQHPERFDVRQPAEIPLPALRAQHCYNLLTLYNTAEASLTGDETFYPMVFPKEKQGKVDPTNLHQAGAFCFDSGTPLTAMTWTAAAWSAASAREAAVVLRKERLPLTYALSRPPGHHATRDLFGGYCYFNNAALAARHLRRFGRVAVLDIDYHHGNGTQSLFYRDDKVLTVSIHGDPRDVFPYFAGYPTETGIGRGQGFNLNLPQPRGLDGDGYVAVLERHALPAIQHYGADFLVVAAGFDTYHKDPVGHFELTTDDFERVGEAVGALGIPAVVVQEGGYYAPHLGRNVASFLLGLHRALTRPTQVAG